MYCRSCHYDLRGQLDPRCPECGGRFSFDDAETYLGSLPTWRSYLRESIGSSGRWSLRLLLGFLSIASVVLAVPNIICCGLPAGAYILSSRNLELVKAEWARQCGGFPINCRFDAAVARRHMSPSFSASLERNDYVRRASYVRKLTKRPYSFFLPCLFGLLLSMTFRNRLRRWLALTAVGTFAVVLCGSCIARPLGNLKFPGSYVFLDDYVYLEPPNVLMCSSREDSSVIAFERNPFHSRGPVVAFANGISRCLHPEELDALLAGGTTESREGF